MESQIITNILLNCVQKIHQIADNFIVFRYDHTANCTGEAVQEKMGTTIKALHAVVVVGLHFTNCRNSKVIIHPIKMNMIPCRTKGLYTIYYTSKDIITLTSFHKRLLKQMQHFSSRMSDANWG